MEPKHYLFSDFTDILTRSPTLQSMVNKAESLIKLNQAVLKKLGPNLSPHCRVTNLRDGILILTTPSPAWGHTLRFSELELLSTLRAYPEWCGLKAIQSRVRPLETSLRKISVGLPAPFMSKLSAEHIQAIAQQITDPKLQKALQRLSSRSGCGM